MERFPLTNGNIRLSNKDRLGKNLSLFKEDGTKIYWGDLAKRDLGRLKGLGRLYVLSEHKSYWSVPEKVVLKTDTNLYHNANVALLGLSKLAKDLDLRDKTKINPEYVKRNKIAAIHDGVWIRNDAEWLSNYS